MQVETQQKHESMAGTVERSSLLGLPQRLGGAISRSWSFFSHKTPAMPIVAALADAVEVDEPVKSLVDEMLERRRYALLLRRQLVGNLTPEQLARTREALDANMCLVPSGEVALSLPNESDGDEDHATQAPVFVEACYLDRYPVTNEEFRHFVARGGYEQMAIWDQEVWPAVLDFVDQTGQPGPRFWREGRCAPGTDNHPVVGVCWYEAAAYARWVGKRLATDGEWVKAGSWPVAIVGQTPMSRRYPWGDAMDRSRANLWGSGPGCVVGIDQFATGVSVGGAHQLIGNVWEWTADPYTHADEVTDSDDSARVNLKSIRGGAFDTYLDSQATCQFRSGDRALARKHNIGFRTAIGLGDLVLSDPLAESELDETLETLEQLDNAIEEDAS